MNSEEIADFIKTNEHKGLKYCGYVIHKTLVPKRQMTEHEREKFMELYHEECKQWGKVQAFKNAAVRFEGLYPNIGCYSSYLSFTFSMNYHKNKGK